METYVNLGAFISILLFLWRLHSDVLKLSDRIGLLEQRIAKI